MKRTRRGFVMLAVIFVLLALFLAAATYFGTTSRAQQMGQTLAAQQVAVARAEFAVQRAIRDIRARAVVPLGLFERPPPNGIPDCGGNCIFAGPVQGPPATGPFQGGGQLWDYVIYKRAQVGSPAGRFTIQGNGYFGRPGADNFTTARIEAELDIDTASGGGGTRGCNACMGGDGFSP